MYKHFIKRFFDLIGSLIILPFVLLEIIILAPFIWLTDKGPVFYNATRAGKNYKPYKMFKLRSMYVNSPDLKNPDGSTYNSDDDPRVTPIGRIMRKTFAWSYEFCWSKAEALEGGETTQRNG